MEIFVNWDRVVTYSHQILVNWQVDNGLVKQGLWDVGTAGDASFMPYGEVVETIRGLSNAEVFSVRVYPFGGNPMTATFQVSGFTSAFEPALQAWRQAGRPSPGHTAEGGGGCFLLPVTGLALVAVATAVIAILV
jgi:hypothetical protein